MFRLLPLVLLTACTPEVLLDILSPAPNEEFVEGVPILLDVAITADGVPANVDPSWSSGDWSAAGNAIEVSDLPLGELTLDVVAEVDGGIGSDSVTISVVVRPPDPIDYSGTISVQADIASPSYTGLIDCTHDYLDFIVEPDGRLHGEGACTVPLFGGFVFVLEGTVSGSTVSGEMATSDNADEPLEFDGTKSEAGTIDATFDNTWVEGDGTMRLFGSFTADPV